MSTTRMLVLALVRWLEPVHGYEVRRELVSWNVEEWANIAPGSIYHALRKLTEEGLLEEVATEKVAGRPARTLYRTTKPAYSNIVISVSGVWQLSFRQKRPPAATTAVGPSTCIAHWMMSMWCAPQSVIIPPE